MARQLGLIAPATTGARPLGQSAAQPTDLAHQIWSGLGSVANFVAGGAADLGAHLGQGAASLTADAAGALGNSGLQQHIQANLAKPQTNLFGQPIDTLKGGTSGVKQVAGDLLKTGANAALVAAPETILGATALGTGIGAAQGAGDALQHDESAQDVVTKGGIGALAGGIFGTAGGLLAKGLSSASALLAHTSNTAAEAFNILKSKPEAAAQIGITPEKALANTQGVVRDLRTQLSAGWKEATNAISTEFEGQRVGLPDKTLALLHKVDDTVGGLEHLPQNPASISAQELINLEKELNKYSSKTAFKISPEGIPLKNLGDQLRELGVKTFGGENGSYDTLYKNYSTQKSVFDAANDIVQAYKTNKPITQATALGRLQKVFDENKPAYLLALKNLEAATGKDVTSGIAASKFTPIMPKFNKVNGDLWTKALTVLAMPLTSPRAASYITRASEPAATGVRAVTPLTAAGGASATDALMNQQ